MASVDLATTSVDPDNEWRLRIGNWGDASYVYNVDEISVEYVPFAKYTGDSDTVKFPATMGDGGPAITYGPDTIGFGAGGSVGLPHEPFMGKGDFVYTMDLAMTDFDDVAGQYGQSIAVDFLPSGQFVELMFLNYDTANPRKYFWNQFMGTNWDHFDDDELGANAGVGNTSIRLSKIAGVVAMSYKGISGEWIEMASVDLATTSVDPDSEWRLRIGNWGDASYVYNVDEISIFLPSGGDTETPVITLNGDKVVDIQLQFEPYVDAGATAEDPQEGDLTDSIIVVGAVDTTVLGAYTVTYEVTDLDGNTGQESRFVNVFAVGNAPGISLTGGAEVSTNFGGTGYDDPGALALDEEDGNITDSIVVGGDTVDVNTLGDYVITYTITDSDGNPIRVARTVTVEDLEGPVITPTGGSLVEVDQGGTYTEAGATATDNLDDAASVTAAIVIGGATVDTATIGSYTVTYTASDAAGNETVATRTVGVLDATPPVIALIGNAETAISQWSTYWDAGATATDDVDVSGVITAAIVVGGSVDANTAGTYILTYNVSDAQGNAAVEVTRTVTVGADLTPPVITLLDKFANPIADINDATVVMPQGGSFEDYGAQAIDDVYGDVGADVVVDTSGVDTSTLGEYSVIYTVTDSAGNTTQATRTVIVEPDIEAPNILIIGDLYTGENDVVLSVGDTYFDLGASASDNADGDLTDNIIVAGKADVDTTVAGVYFITYNVTDAAGNAAEEKTRMVTVMDSSISGIVEDPSGVPLAGVLVEFYMPFQSSYNFIDIDNMADYKTIGDAIIVGSAEDFDQWRYETLTAADGTFDFTLPVDAPLFGWIAVISKDGYASTSLGNLDPDVGARADFSGSTALRPKKAIVSVTATAGASNILLKITGNPVFTDAGQVTVQVKSGDGTVNNGNNTLSGDGSIQAVYSGIDDFTAIISTDTAKLAFSYVANDADLISKRAEIEPSGGFVDLTTEGGQPAGVEIPAGGLTILSATVQMTQRPIEAVTVANEGSHLYLYEVTAFDNSNGAVISRIRSSDTNSDGVMDTDVVLINRIEITLPIDLSVVSPNDLENGVYRIYEADSMAAFDEIGDATVVSADQIITTDYVGDGLVGSVTFWVDDLSVFGIGGVRTDLADRSQQDTSPTSCFVNTIAHGQSSGGNGGSLLPFALIPGFMLIAVLLNRIRGRSGKAITGLAVLVVCAFLIVDPAHAQDGKLYVELNGMYAFEGIDAGQTQDKFTDPVAVDFDGSPGFQFAVGYVFSDSFSVKAVFEYVTSFEALKGLEFEASDKLAVLHGSVNAKLSYPAWQKVKPYLVAGLGVMRAHENIFYGGGSTSGADSKTRDVGVGLRGGAGVDVFVTDSVSIGIEGLFTTGRGEVAHVEYTAVSVGIGYHF